MCHPTLKKVPPPMVASRPRDSFRTQLSYLCFTRALGESRWLIVGCYDGSRHKKGRKPLN